MACEVGEGGERQELPLPSAGFARLETYLSNDDLTHALRVDVGGVPGVDAKVVGGLEVGEGSLLV